MRNNFIHCLLKKAVWLFAILTFSSSLIQLKAEPTATNPDLPSTQQDRKDISGIVAEVSGEPIIGANVVEQSTGNGTITDLDGKFTLSVAPNATIVISYIGYVDQLVPVGNKTSFKITLKEDSQSLDEVVVVGYGTQKKVNLSGSVASVNISELTDSRPITNVSSALYGTAPGVYVNSSNNRPSNQGDATILVRGQGTLNNSSPLVIVDGVESSMNSVNPQDIATISILKDAASSAIYGSRAANGVILITTKAGSTGAMKIEYNGYVSFETLNKPFDLVTNYADYMGYLNEGLLNSNKPRQFSDEVIALWRSHENDADKTKYPNTDIFDVYKTGVSHQHNISASGGTEKLTFFTSFNYLDNPGILENTGYKRYSFRSNLDAKLKDWIKIGTNLSAYTSNASIVSDQLDDFYKFAMAGGNPGIALLDDQNRLGINANGEDDPQNATNNPYSRLRDRVGDINIYNLKARFYGTLFLAKGLSVQASYSYEFWNETKTSKPNFVPMWNFQTGEQYTEGKTKTSIMNRDEKRFRNQGDIVALYENRFADDRLSLNLMVGASQEQFRREYHQVTRNDLLDPSLWAIDGAIGESSSGGNIVEWAMQSYFGRINLGWEDKYLFEANLRRDGSSRFLKNNRWGVFPSFSVAWRVSEEDFMKSVDWLDNLKIRASYGSLGNNSLGKDKDLDGNYSALSTYAQSNYVLGNNVVMGLSQTALANAMLTWEKVNMTNIGVDFNVLGNRLGGSLEYFNRYTKDILIDLPAPLVHGNATLPRQNAAEVSNKGVEVSLTWNDRVGKDFRYNVGFNVTHIKNNVEKFRGKVMSFDSSNSTMILEGHSINTLYALEVDRIVSTQADMDHIQSLIDNAEPGKVVFPFGRPQMGDILYKDNSGDGIINNEDRVPIGSGNTPKWTYGFSLGASWNGFDFSMLMQGVAGIKDIYYSNLNRSTVRMGYQLNQEIIDGRWYEGRTTPANYPRLLDFGDTRNEQMSTLWIAKKDYLKIRNIQLGYTLPTKWTQIVNVDKVRVYGSLENFFTFTNWKGYDPEISGITYPTMREAVIGLSVSF